MKRIIALLAVCIWILPLHAQQLNFKLSAPRPKVGVALGGGGAKGAAHIGVLKYLEEIGIPIDYVAGTSIGSIIGGLYAMGYSPDELATLIANMNWSEYVGNSIDRSAMSLETRQRQSTYLVNLPFSLSRLFSSKLDTQAIGFIPSAFVNNTALINLFNDLCVGYQKDMDFNDLPIPFACVATDIKTGREIDIRYGSVPTAMRASMAIPGVFSPVAMNNHLLVDGGLVNNFPADLVKEMGADIIIGVEVTDADTVISEDDVTLPDILNGLIDNAVNNKRFENQALCDVHLTPDISGYGTLSFNHDAIDTLVNRGYQEAKRNDAALRSIKQKLDSIYGAPLEKKLRATKAKNLGDAPVYISSIVINQTDKVKSSWLLRKGKLQAGQFLSENNINDAVDIYRGTGAFDAITYNLTENGLDTINGEFSKPTP
jgi:NTE family protein